MHPFSRKRSVRDLVVSSLFSMLLLPLTAQATIRYVAYSPVGNNTAKGGVNDCSKAKNPCLTIKHAVSQAKPNDSIFIAPNPYGWYSEIDVYVDKDLSFVGSGTTRTHIHAWEPGSNGRHFIIDTNVFVRISNLELTGGIAPDGGSIVNHGRLTLLNCRVTDNFAITRGGAIYNDGGTLVISASEIENNGTDYGGAVYNGEGGDLIITNTSTITNNSANSGGAIYVEAGTIAAIQGKSTLYNNRANTNGGGIYVEENGSLSIFSESLLHDHYAHFDGGVIFNNGGRVTISGSLFLNNSARLNGGVVFNNGGTVSLLSSVFLSNSVEENGGVISNVGNGRLTVEKISADYNSADQGGVIFNDTADANITTIRENTFVGNSATQNGGALANVSGTIRAELTTFATNSADSSGGAIANVNDGRFSVSQSTFDANAANRGGAIFDVTTASSTIATGISVSTFVANSAGDAGGAIYYNPTDGYLSISNSTFSENAATNRGGAIMNGAAGIGTIAIANATFYGNAAADGASIYNRQGFNLDNSIITHSIDSVTGAFADACSLTGIPLGGTNNMIGTFPSTDSACNPTASFNKGAVFGLAVTLQNNGGPTATHALDLTSTAIDAGFGNCPGPILGTLLMTDQRGIPRPQGATCDIGAVEQQ
ncbi:MAG: choice-of-anchor Q domain-containing protein [Candidatus Binatia bacterium]